MQGQEAGLNDLSKNLPCIDKTFCLRVVMTVDSASRAPLVSQEDVTEMLDQAASYFEPICVDFDVCDFEVLPNYGYNDLFNKNRIREMGVLYGHTHRINVFIADKVHGDNCGYAPFGGFATATDARIYIELDCQDGPAEQMAKHMGTLLGLYDTNHNGYTELVDGSNCAIAGDSLCSTPADPFGFRRNLLGQWEDKASKEPYYSGCEFIWEHQDDNEAFYTPSTTNIMSPYPCKCHFTYEQFEKMVETYNESLYKQY